MIRKEAIAIAAKMIRYDPIVSANGYISRDLFDSFDKPTNFYMIGSMGLASSIALGIAIKNPKKRVFIFDGDGNILMNLGSLTTIGNLKPKNLVHIIFDNNSHESTGGQPTNTKKIRIDHIAKAANYNVFKIQTKQGFFKIFNKIKTVSGPIMILVQIDKNEQVSKRISLSPTKIKSRFMRFL